ncbi:MAG: glycosyl hydrolase family 28 protein, partial [Lachnospiraceae bacterium]
SKITARVNNVKIQDCIFLNTDRGLRVKTRRGRGKDSVLDNIVFENIRMDNVMTPFVVNSFYFCDPDGKTEYVACKEPLPVDERTPSIDRLIFRNIECHNCHVAVAYIYGLPEQKIVEVTMENVHIDYAEEAKSGVAAMMLGCDESCRRGIVAANVKKLKLENVKIEGASSEPFELTNVDSVISK